jgi:hypothetical protein
MPESIEIIVSVEKTEAGRVFLQNMRAGMIKQAKDLQEQRAAILQQAAAIEQYLKVDKPQESKT